MKVKKYRVMESVPVNPKVTFDSANQENFKKRVVEVIAKVETDPGSAHLFEPMSDVIRERCIKDLIRREVGEGVFTEYQICREHARTRFALKGQLEILNGGKEIDENDSQKNGTEFEKTFFETETEMRRSIFKEVE